MVSEYIAELPLLSPSCSIRFISAKMSSKYGNPARSIFPVTKPWLVKVDGYMNPTPWGSVCDMEEKPVAATSVSAREGADANTGAGAGVGTGAGAGVGVRTSAGIEAVGRGAGVVGVDAGVAGGVFMSDPLELSVSSISGLLAVAVDIA